MMVYNGSRGRLSPSCETRSSVFGGLKDSGDFSHRSRFFALQSRATERKPRRSSVGEAIDRLETTELLSSLLGRLVLGNLEHVETNSLGERTALANGDGVADLDTESGRDVGGNVLVALLVSRVLGHKVQVLSADDDGAGHLGRDDLAGQDTATDRDETSPRALLVCRNGSGMRCKGDERVES